MNNNYDLTAENLLTSFPLVLQQDIRLQTLAAVTADILAARTDEINSIAIYPRISALPESLLDILADDFKVDWYNYNHPLEVKRSVLKNSFYVHRKMGTKSAVCAALSSVYPNSTVEEWFEYGGDPYYFRCVLDVTQQTIDISNDDILRLINIFKPLRAWLEDDAVVYRARAALGIGLSVGYVVYTARLCGTYPVRARQGVILNPAIAINTGNDGVAYATPMTGDHVAGTYPATAVQGAISEDDVLVAAENEGTVYTVPKSGESVAGTYPVTTTQGSFEAGGINAGASAAGASYSTKLCGTFF